MCLTGNSFLPTAPVPPPPALSGQVAAGNKHSLAVGWDGALFTWGRSADGQCGHGDVERKAVPTRVQQLAGVCVVAAAAGELDARPRRSRTASARANQLEAK